MKAFRKISSVFLAITMLLVSAVCVSAIGFDAEEAYESVFVIYSGNALGSGFAVGENCIVTNAHVITNTRDITVETYGGQEYDAAVVGMDEELDIAILAVMDATFPYLEIAQLSEMKTGSDIYAIGAPQGMAYTLTKGTISAKERQINGQTYIQTDAAINQGNSGGPLLSDAGKVLGMNTLKMSNAEGIGLAIPASRICDYLENLGISLNSAGNVQGRLDSEDIPSQLPGFSGSDSGSNSDNYLSSLIESILSTLSPITLLSIGGCITFMILWLTEKKKNKKKKTPPQPPQYPQYPQPPM